MPPRWILLPITDRTAAIHQPIYYPSSTIAGFCLSLVINGIQSIGGLNRHFCTKSLALVGCGLALLPENRRASVTAG
jgi:hypothetical protein